jgi:thiol:disulfide interchange protein DsbC
MKQIQSERKDVAFYLKMFPLVQIHPDSYGKAKAIVCEKESKGDAAALKLLEDAYGHKKLPAASCETTAVDDNMKLGQPLGLRGTPAMVFEDGTIVKGAVNGDVIKQKLDSLK